MLEDVQLHLVDTLEEANELKRWLGERRPILGIDTETDAGEWWSGRLRLVQVGDAHTGWAIPYEDGWPWFVRELLDGYEGDVAMHGVPFDRTWLEVGARVDLRGQCHDTLNRARLIEPWRPAALKTLTAEIIDQSAWVGQGVLDAAMARQGWTWGTVPVQFEWYWVYGALDAVLAARLFEHQEPRLTELGLQEAYDLELRVAEPLRQAELHGIRVDFEYCREQQTVLVDYIDATRAWVMEKYGVYTGSNEKVVSLLLQDGIKLWKKTDSGKFSLDKEVLSEIQHPLAEAVLNVRKAEKLAGTYFENLINRPDGEVVHPRIKPLGARTGRMSMEKPSLHNLPRTALIRDSFIAREEHKLITCDFEQIELRLLAAFSQDPALKAICEADVDAMTALARTAHHDDTISKDGVSHGDLRRQHMKNGVYAWAYGAGSTKFADTAGISYEEGDRIYQQFDETLAGTRQWKEQTVLGAQLVVPSRVTTPTGRMLPLSHGSEYTTAVNYLIQGTAAEVLKRQIVEMDRAGLTPFFVVPVHDEVVLDVPDAHVEDVMRELPDVMEATLNGVTLPAEATGPYERWGDKYS